MIYKKTVVTLVLFVFTIFKMVAKSSSPPPPDNGLADPPTPPVPIDGHSTLILILALFLGIYIIYSQIIKTKKTPL
ncbi:hypothetical protein RCH18_001622 [Flavobacterium sp. PL11]|jgi:hypothetical protein|nr:hypothetical protein [Flavobacterium sp. PL11]